MPSFLNRARARAGLLGVLLLLGAMPCGHADEPATDGGVADGTPGDALPAAAATPAPTGPQARAARVIIISEDGLRPDLVAAMDLPWHESLYRHGAYTWRARTIRDASTLPAHASMLSGVDENEHGLTWNNWRPEKGYIKVPTIFDEADKVGMTTAMFVGKPKLRHIAPPGSVEEFERPGYYCKKVAEDAAAYLVEKKPTLTFVHFSNPDDAGHAKGWGTDAYKQAILDSDHCLGIVLKALDEAKMLDDTLIIVSADHGGHNRVHSGGMAIDREIPWIVRGPGVRQNYRLHGDVSTTDTAATALWVLGIPIPSRYLGKPVEEAFVR